MQLPQIHFGSVPDETSPGLERVRAATAGLSETVQQGLALYGRELVKTQTQAARLDLAKRLDATESDLRTRQAIPVEEVKQRLGEARWGALDPTVKNQPVVKVQDPETGQIVEKQADIPTWAVAGDLFDAEAEKAVGESATHITVGSGWQGAFRGAAADHLVERRAALNQMQLQAMMKYQVETRGRQVLDAALAGDYGPDGSDSDLGGAGAMIQGGLPLWGAAGAEELRQKVLGIKQEKRVADVLAAAENPDLRPAAIATLREIEKRGADPAFYSALPREARDHLRAQVRATVLQADAAELVAKAEAEPDRTKQTDVILGEKDPNVQRAARELFAARDAVRDAQRREEQRLLGSRLVYKLEERNGHYDLESDPEWERADDGTKVAAMARKRALERERAAANRQDRATAAEARRVQAEENKIARADFDALTPDQKAGPPLVERLPSGRYAPTTELFASADQPTLAKINALQASARNAFAKGHRVGYDEFRSRVASSLKGKSKHEREAIQGKLDEWYFAESDKSADGAPPDDKKIAAKLVDSLEVVDVAYGIDKERILVEDPADIRGPLPADAQWYEPAKASRAPSAPAAPARPAAAPSKPLAMNTSQVPMEHRQTIIDEYHAWQRSQGQPEGPVPASEIVRGYNAGVKAGRF